MVPEKDASVMFLCTRFIIGNWKLYILAVILMWSSIASSSELVEDGKTVRWATKVYKTILPSPFGQVSTTFEIGEEGGIADLFVRVSGRDVSIPMDKLRGLKSPAGLSVSYESVDQGRPTWIKLSFGYGRSYRSKIVIDGELVGGDCAEWLTRYAVVTIHDDFTVDFEKSGPEPGIMLEVVEIKNDRVKTYWAGKDGVKKEVKKK